MRQITVMYHQEDGVWWAESPSIPGFSSAAGTMSELRKLTHEAIDFEVDGAPHMVLEVSAPASVPPSEQSRGGAGAGSIVPHLSGLVGKAFGSSGFVQRTNGSLAPV